MVLEVTSISEESVTAAPYCDVKSTAGALAPLIASASGAVTLEEETTIPRLRTPRSSRYS